MKWLSVRQYREAIGKCVVLEESFKDLKAGRQGVTKVI